MHSPREEDLGGRMTCIAEVLAAVALTSMLWGFWVLHLMCALDFAKTNLRLEQEFCAALLKTDPKRKCKTRAKNE